MQSLPNWLVKGLGGLLIAFVAISVAIKAKDLTDVYGNKNPQKTMTVSATGKVQSVPDMATVTLGVVSQGSTAADVQSQNSQKINKIVEYVKQQGISKDDISTSQFNVYPRYDYQKGDNSIVGYEARQTITIKVKGVDKATEGLGKILAGAASNGANEVNGVNLGFEDPDNLRQQARKQAIDKAKEKAQELAQTAGIKLGRVVSVSESSVYGYPMLYGEGMGGGGLALDKAASPNIEPGSQDITAEMSVVFEVK